MVNTVKVEASDVTKQIEYAVIVVGSGAFVEVTSLTLYNIGSKGVEGMIMVESLGKLRLSSSSVENVETSDSCVVSAQNAKSMEVDSSNFTKHTRTASNGSCLSIVFSGVVSERSVLVENNTFKEMEVVGGRMGGGGVYAAIGSGVSLLVKGSTFLQCKSPLGKEDSTSGMGKGGGMFLRLLEVEVNWSIQTPTFALNTASWGKNVFVVTPSLISTIIGSRMPFYDGGGKGQMTLF